jgi:anti-anti-sigma regulatory factor
MDIFISKEQARVPVTVLKLTGRLDATTQEQLRSTGEKEIKRGVQYVLLDFSGVDYMSSAGIRAINYMFDLLRPRSPASDAAMERGLRDGSYKSPHLKIANPQPVVLEAMKMVGIDMFFEIHSDPQSALAAF